MQPQGQAGTLRTLRNLNTRQNQPQVQQVEQPKQRNVLATLSNLDQNPATNSTNSRSGMNFSDFKSTFNADNAIGKANQVNQTSVQTATPTSAQVSTQATPVAQALANTNMQASDMQTQFNAPSIRTSLQTPQTNTNTKPSGSIITRALQNAQKQIENNQGEVETKVNNLKQTVRNMFQPDLSDDENGWRQYYNSEFKKVSGSQDLGQRLLDQGAASRTAEINARNKYVSALLDRAYDDNGNVINEDYAKRASALANDNSQVAESYNRAEKAQSRKVGASYDSDYKDNPLYATANTIRNMSVADAVLGADDTQSTDARDVAKFLVDLVPGMLTAPVQGATNLSEAISGSGTDAETGRHRDLGTLERMGRGVSGAIDAAGVFFGGSADLLNAGAKVLFKKGANEAVKRTSKSVIKSYLKSMLEEGAEEGVQQAFEFFGDGNKLTTSDGDFDQDAFKQLLQETGQVAALGAVGGGIFKAGGDIINLANNAIQNRKINRIAQNTTFDNNGNAMKTNPDGATQRLSDTELAQVAKEQNLSAMDKTKNAVDNLYSKAVNKRAVDRLAQGIDQGTDGNIKFARMTKDVFDDINSIRTANGLDPLTRRQVTAYQNAVNNNLGNRVNEGLGARQVAQIAFNSLTSENARGIPGYYENQVAVSAPGLKNDYDASVIGLAEDGGTSLKSIEPRTQNQVSLFEKQGQQKDGPKTVKNGFSLADGRQPTSNSSIPQNSENSNIPAKIETQAEQNSRFDKQIKNYYKKYGDNFEEKLPAALHDRYSELLASAKKDKNGVYTDPVTGARQIDEAGGIKQASVTTPEQRAKDTFDELVTKNQKRKATVTGDGKYASTSDNAIKALSEEIDAKTTRSAMGELDQLVRKLDPRYAANTPAVDFSKMETNSILEHFVAVGENINRANASLSDTPENALKSLEKIENKYGLRDTLREIRKYRDWELWGYKDFKDPDLVPNMSEKECVAKYNLEHDGDRKVSTYDTADLIEKASSTNEAIKILNDFTDAIHDHGFSSADDFDFRNMLEKRPELYKMYKEEYANLKKLDKDARPSDVPAKLYNDYVARDGEYKLSPVDQSELNDVLQDRPEDYTSAKEAYLKNRGIELRSKGQNDSRGKNDNVSDPDTRIYGNETERDALRQRLQESLNRNRQQPAEDVRQVATGTEPLGKAADGTPEFVRRGTSQTELGDVDNSKVARRSRMRQYMESLKDSDSAIAKKFYDLWHGDRKKAKIADLSENEIRRYVTEGNVALARDAKFVMTENFVRHLDNDGHLTGIRSNPEARTGIQIDANPLTKKDVAVLDEVLKSPDTIRHTGKGSKGGEKLKVEKRLGDNMRAIVEVVNNGKELELVSYYKTNKAPLEEALPTSGNSGSSGTAEQANPARGATEPADNSGPATALSQSITDSVENVKVGEQSSKNNNTPEAASETPADAGMRVYENEVEKLPDDFDVDRYVTDQVKAQKKRNKLPLKQRIGDVTAELKHLFIDDAVAYERYIKDKNERLNIREGVDRVRSSDMIARQWATERLSETAKLSTKEMNGFQQYLIAKRAIEVAGQGKKTGRNLAADRALIEHVGDKYAAQEAEIRQYTKDMLEYSAENGLISKRLKDDLLRDNPNYVPLNRVFDTLEEKPNFRSKQLGNLSKQSVVKKLEGSERTIENPIESLLSNTMRMVNEVERNKTAKLITQSEAFHEKMLAEGEKPRPGYDTLNYLVDGKKVSYEVPKLVAQEMKNLNSVLPDAAEAVLKYAGAPTKWLRAGATQNNPLFALSNLLRDQMQTFITGEGEGVLKSNIWRNVKGAPKAVAATLLPGKKASAYRAELNRAGIIGSEYRQTYGKSSDNLVKQLQTDAKLTRKAVDSVRHPVETLGDVIGLTEYFTRAQQYFGTSGDAVAKAQASRNNTLNFSRAGSATRIVNRLVPFLNASVQGGRATVNSMVKRPVHTTLALAGLAGVAAAAKGLFEAQDKELWDRLDDSDKGQNIIVPQMEQNEDGEWVNKAHYDPSSNRVEGVIKIPVAQMTYPVLDAVNNLKGNAEDYLRLAGDIFTATTGLETPNEEQGILPVLNQMTPTIAKPLLETSMNKSTYTGNEVVSEYDAEKAPEDKGAKYTTGVAREVARITGIDAPVVDNFIQNYGGGLAKDLSQTLTDNPDNTKDGGGVQEWWDNGFNRRFLSGTVTSQYEIAEGLAKNYKDTVRQNETFQNLSSADQESVLKAITTDMNSIAGVSAKVEQGRGSEIKNKLTKRQTGIVNDGFNADSYIQSVLDKKATYSGTNENGESSGSDVSTLSGNVSDYGNTSSGSSKKEIEISDGLRTKYSDLAGVLEKYNSMSKDDWETYISGSSAEEAAAEFQLASAKFNNDVESGQLEEGSPAYIKRLAEVNKMAVSQSYEKKYREAYSLASNKEEMQTYLNGLDDETREKTIAILNGLNNKMLETGMISESTYKTRVRAINNWESSSSSGRKGSSKSGSSSGSGMSAAEISAAKSAMKALSSGTSGYDVKTAKAPTMIATRRTRWR